MSKMKSEADMTPEEKNAMGRAFAILKSVSNVIAGNPSYEYNPQDLRRAFSVIEPELRPKFLDYCLYPLFLHMSNKHHHKEKTMCLVLECVQVVLGNIMIDDANNFWKIFSLTFLQINDETKPGHRAPCSEELMLAVVKTASLLMERTQTRVFDMIYSRDFHSKFCVGVFTCCHIARTEKYLKLRVESLRCVQLILQVHSSQTISASLRSKVVSIVVLMVPGVVSCCHQVIKVSDVQNHSVIVKAIELWGKVIALVMEDEKVQGENDIKELTFKNKPIFSHTSFLNWKDNRVTSMEEVKEIIKHVARDTLWLEESGKAMVRVTVDIVNLQLHDHYKVRLQIAIEADRILSKAPRNMWLSVKYFVEALIVLSQDSHASVRDTSVKALAKLAKSCELTCGKKLVEVVEECFYSLITKLPRLVRGMDLTLIEKYLMLLSGYLDILGPTHTPLVLNSAQHLKRLLLGLYAAAAVDYSGFSLLEGLSVFDLEKPAGGGKAWTLLKSCSTPKYESLLKDICGKLLQFSDSYSIIYSLLDDFDSNELHRKEITMILCLMLSSERSKDLKDSEQILRLIIMAPIHLSLWELPTGISGAKNLVEIQSNVSQVCLLAELSATVAEVLGPEKFSPFLLRTLYPLLECAGSPVGILSDAGLSSLNRVAAVYGGKISDLVAKNVDYLSHHVNLNLRFSHRNPKVLAVLSVIMRHLNLSGFPFLHEIINDVLVQSCDSFQEVNAVLFLNVFRTFVFNLSGWLQEQTTSVDPSGASGGSVFDELLKHHSTHQQAEDYEGNGEDAEPEEPLEPAELEDEKEKIPDHIKLTVDILTRALHFLPSKNTSQQIIVLEIIQKGVGILSTHRNQLLPIVHKVWSPLVHRFDENNHSLTIQRAFSLLATLAQTSKDFIRSRALKDVIPSICEILKRNLTESKKHKRDDSYWTSQKFKLQLVLLNGIGDLVVDLDLVEKEIHSLLEAVLPYLSNVQPLDLQEAAFKSVEKIAKKESHAVWAQIMYICPKITEFTPPNPQLNKYIVEPASAASSSEFMKNLFRLFDVLE